ncbi:uncharacterized protein LOC114291630 [Camellia sinensis]|uniref:uncharacterized protein LOC114291630 n=1 Tax=Camellia sinensis TaxID=4442 RepID=UPI0010360AB2|nr:uncharacterized protein LOC114291630 [Camellia sinensis]
MAQEEGVNVRVDTLGDDDGKELAAQYRTEAQMVGAGVGETMGESQASALILAPKPLSQVEPEQWHTKADKSTLTVANLEVIRERYQIPAEPKGGDLGRAELEARRKAQEIEDRAILAKAAKFAEAQRDRPPQPIARERIRPRPRPLGEKDLSSFEPRPPPVDPVKEKAGKAVEALKKKKKRRSAPEEAADASGAKRAKAAPTEVEVPVGKDAPEVVEIIPTVEVVKIVPSVQVEAGSTEVVPSGMEQVQKRPDPQKGGVRPATAIYHARAVAGRLEGEEGPARVGADRLVKIVEETALRAASGYNEADLLRGLCSAQMEVTTLAGALLRKAGTAKLKVEEARVQLAKLKKDSADWKTAHDELPKKLEESERACAVAVERHEEAMTSNEELVRQKDEANSRIGDLLKELGEERARAEEENGRLLRAWEIEKAKAVAELESLKKGVEEERATAAAERGALQRKLDEERAKAASEKAAYPDLCVAAVE